MNQFTCRVNLIMSLIGFEAWRGWGKARHGMFLGGAAHAISEEVYRLFG